jgi:hypothetical protein
VGDNALRVTESMLSLLKAGGVDDQAAAYAADLLSDVRDRHRLRAEPLRQLYSDPEHEMREVGADRRALRRRLARALPTIAALRAQLTSGDGEERFSLGSTS